MGRREVDTLRFRSRQCRQYSKFKINADVFYKKYKDPKKMLDVILNSFPDFIELGLGAYPADEQQIEFICAVQKALSGDSLPKITVRSGHSCGKSTMLAWVILYIGILYPDAKLVATAPVQGQLMSILIPEIRKWRDGMFPLLKRIVEPYTTKVEFKTGNTLIARTARPENSEALAGIHGSFVLYVVDEASGVDNRIFEVIEGSLTGKHLFIMISNPTRTIGYFYDSHNTNKEKFQRLHFSTENSAVADIEWVRDMRKTYGIDSPIYKVRVLGEFADKDANSLFDRETLELAGQRELEPEKDLLHIMSVDPARFGSDTTTIWGKRGRKATLLEVLRQNDTMEIANRVYELWLKDSAEYVIVDTIGIGAGVFDRLKELGVPVVDGNSARKSVFPNKYVNKRAEMYDRLAEWIIDADIPDDDLLFEELIATEYSFTKTGKMQILDKDLIKKDIGRSPDRADGLALLFYDKFVRKTILKDDPSDYLPD